MRVKVPGNKYIWMVVVVLVVFTVVFVWKGIAAAAFWSVIAVVIMVYLAFDPRIKRHWQGVVMNISPDILNLIDDIKKDKIHGASQLARQAVGVLKTAAEHSQAKTISEFLLEQREIGDRLMLVRPTMAPIFNIVTGLLAAIAREGTGMDLESIRHLTISRADEVFNDSLRAVAQIARHGSELIAGGDRVLTHSYSSTVVAVLKEAFTRHGNIEVIATRSGPGRTGEQIIRELGNYGIAATFIDDTAVGLYLPEVNEVMLGADRVCADGKVINGVGSYQVALASERAGIPCYVLCDMLKFDPRIRSDDVDLEEKEPSEVVEPGKLPAGVRVKNPHFDVTPLELITGVVTEKGLLAAEAVVSYMAGLQDM